MARATRASGERNPKAMRVRSRSFHALHPVIRQSVAERSADAGAVVTDRAGQLHERGEPAVPGPAHVSQASSNEMPSAPLS